MDFGEKFDADLNLSGLLCPLPVLKTGKKLRMMADGQVLRVKATDPMSVIDLPHYCQEQGFTLLHQWQEGLFFYFLLRAGLKA